MATSPNWLFSPWPWLCAMYMLACIYFFIYCLQQLWEIGTTEHSFFFSQAPLRNGKKFRKIKTARRKVNSLTIRPIKPLPPVRTLCLSSCYGDEWSLLLAKATSGCGLDPARYTYSRSLLCNSLPFPPLASSTAPFLVDHCHQHANTSSSRHP